MALLAARVQLAVRLAIVGNGQLADRVEAEIESLGVAEYVRLFPFRGSVGAYLSALDVFVLPSLWEALPLGPIEAMMCGIPVVATDVGGVPEIIDHQRTGLLVPAGNADALASALGALMADSGRRTAMGDRGRAVATSRFGLDRMVDQVEAVYEDVLLGPEAQGAPEPSGRPAQA
jgi:glycosyltransferase involved in cell wall biosynthesis